VRRLVLDYYVVLRSVLRDKPQVGRILTRCRHCWIFFIADPRNAGRDDLGCPFGCADLHRRRRSTERSVRYNGSPVGKLKRHQREEERRPAGDPSAAEASQAAEVHRAATVEVTHDATAPILGSGPRGPAMDPPAVEVPRPASGFMAGSAKTTAASPVSEAREDRGDRSSGEPGPSAIGGCPPAGPEQLEFARRIVAYVRVVISLLEGRNVHRVEILEMLVRTRRQHGFAREKRIDYVLRRLREEPEKPP
jgi:hypothetical protein